MSQNDDDENTDDGIWRATMGETSTTSSTTSDGFNTDDGIRRATISKLHAT